MKKLISSLMVLITLFSSLPSVLAGKNDVPFQGINDQECVEFLDDCSTVVTDMCNLPFVPLVKAMASAYAFDKLLEFKNTNYSNILHEYSKLVDNRNYKYCICRHYAAYAFLKLHNIGRKCLYVMLYDIDRNRQRDHAVTIYSVLENGKEVWKVCDISYAIMAKNKNVKNYRVWLSMNLSDYLNVNDNVIQSFACAIAMDDPDNNSINTFSNQNANDLKLYLAKYTPEYARSFIRTDLGTKLRITNINAVNTGFGTSVANIGVEGSEKLRNEQFEFLHNFIDGNTAPNTAPNV